MRLIDADALIQSLEKKHAHWHELVTEENKEIEYAHQYAVNVIRNAPSAEPTGDLISREDAIKAIAVAVLDDKDEIEAIKALPSADAKPTVIQSKTLFPTKDFMEWAKRIKEVNPNAVVIPCDAEVASAEAVQGKESGSKLDLISRELAMERIAKDNVVGGMERINEYNNSTEFNEYLDGISDAITTVFCDVPSADITETETCQRCQESVDTVLNRQGERIKELEASAEAETSLKAIKRQIDEHWYLDPPSDEAVQSCDGCIYNTRIPQEQCLRCKRYWIDSYERKGGDDE